MYNGNSTLLPFDLAHSGRSTGIGVFCPLGRACGFVQGFTQSLGLGGVLLASVKGKPIGHDFPSEYQVHSRQAAVNVQSRMRVGSVPLSVCLGVLWI